MSSAEVRAQCEQWLNERWQGVYSNQHGALIVPNMGKTACFVECSDTPDGLTRVNIHAPILMNINTTPDVFRLVALNGANWRFGALSLYEEDGVHMEFDYSLLGEGLTGGELNFFVDLIAKTADDMVDRLQPLVGGRPVY